MQWPLPNDYATPPAQVFPGHSYTSLASLSRNVPILSCGALSKKYMVPGWRDRNHSFAREVAPGLARLARQNLNPCSLIQASLPHIFTAPKSYHQKNIAILHRNATLVHRELLKAPGLVPIMPAGAMYMMVRKGYQECGCKFWKFMTSWFCLLLQVRIEMDRFPDFESDLEFTKQLLKEESVFCLPATVSQLSVLSTPFCWQF